MKNRIPWSQVRQQAKPFVKLHRTLTIYNNTKAVPADVIILCLLEEAHKPAGIHTEPSILDTDTAECCLTTPENRLSYIGGSSGGGK